MPRLRNYGRLSPNFCVQNLDSSPQCHDSRGAKGVPKMKKKASAISVLCLLAGIYLGAQLQQLRLSIGGTVLELDMSKQEALRKLSACCKPFPFGKTAVMVMD